MSAPLAIRLVAGLGLAATVALLGGCSYDYMQHSDRVGYSAGNAVKANLQQQTIDPSKDSQYVTTGLGKNGVIRSKPSGEAATQL